MAETRQLRPELLTGNASAELDALLGIAVERMAERGFTVETFAAARANWRKVLGDWPLGSEEISARRLQQLRNGSLSICPLWPFC